ncbi:hypothetical protein [Lacihabitans lacunae]|uniref:Uncharacterized protein n=1 Tax=Lacihabitans lacunae TaxID=1028214 RepID=A0ABV7YSP2_9BACT
MKQNPANFANKLQLALEIMQGFFTIFCNFNYSKNAYTIVLIRNYLVLQNIVWLTFLKKKKHNTKKHMKENTAQNIMETL